MSSAQTPGLGSEAQEVRGSGQRVQVCGQVRVSVPVIPLSGVLFTHAFLRVLQGERESILPPFLGLEFSPTQGFPDLVPRCLLEYLTGECLLTGP